jgi:hypothetical protein
VDRLGDTAGVSIEATDLFALAARRPLTVDDLPAAGSCAARHELIDGSRYVTPLADLEHQDLIGSFISPSTRRRSGARPS